MKKSSFLLLFFFLFIEISWAQRVLSLDSCRALAIHHNKNLLIQQDQIEAATYENKAAKTKYLPKLSGEASYIFNARETHLLSKDQRNSLNNLGTNSGTALQQVAQQIAQQYPDMLPLIQNLGTKSVPLLNNLGKSITRAFETNTHNIFAGALVLTQPLYMGGRIKAYNNITNYAKLLLGNQYNNMLQNVILEIDQAYWQTVSLTNKKELAESYITMLEKLNNDIQKMYKEGLTTKASTLTVAVKLNEAEMALMKVENGLSLSKMLLCQLCGIPVNENIKLADENVKQLNLTGTTLLPDTLQAYSNRTDLKALEQATLIAKENVKIVRSAFLPNIALIGAYTLTNPNIYNGFHNKFGDNLSIGVSLHVPIWRWNEGKYHIRAAKAEARASLRTYEEAKEMINLQLNQAKYKADEAIKQLSTAERNLEKADENLKYADIGFHEGMIPASDLLTAQTAWIDAQSQKIDAQIEIKLAESTLIKALGKNALDF